jgi:hypothetical protein
MTTTAANISQTLAIFISPFPSEGSAGGVGTDAPASIDLTGAAVKRRFAARRNYLAATPLVADNQGDAPTHSREATMTTNPDLQPSSRPDDDTKKPLRISAIVWLIIAVVVVVVALVVVAIVLAGVLAFFYLRPSAS